MSTSPLERLSARLLQCKEATLPPDFLDALNTIAEETYGLMNERAGQFLHELDNTKHSEDEVHNVIVVFPQAISYTLPGDGDGKLPIQSAAVYRPDVAMSFIPLLAIEGDLHDTGGEDKRGGLLSIVPSSTRSSNLIQLLANISKASDPFESDFMCLNTLQTLRNIGLLCKDDIDKYSLLFNASYPSTRMRFDFFAQWAPEMLRTAAKAYDGVPLIHDALIRVTPSSLAAVAAPAPGEEEDNHQNVKDRFELVFETYVEHFPHEQGLLFLKHEGVTACEVAFSLFGTEETMSTIICRYYIPPSDNRPILHSVILHAPQFMDVFTRYYFNASYVRDSDHRTLFHAALASGNVSFESNATFFSTCSDEQVGEKDPVTGLFPFALAASRSICDLDAVYTLLRRAPGLISWGDDDNAEGRVLLV